MNSMQFSQPNSPQPKGTENGEETMEGGEVAEHEEENQKQVRRAFLIAQTIFPFQIYRMKLI